MPERPCRMCGQPSVLVVCSAGCGRRLVASLCLRLAELHGQPWAVPLCEVADDLLEHGGEPVAWCGVASLLERLIQSKERPSGS